MDSKKYWITWNNSQRSRSLAALLGYDLHCLDIDAPAFIRHAACGFWTITFLLRARPKQISIQYSFALLLILHGYKTLHPGKVYIACDCHTKALRRSVRGAVGKVFWSLKRSSFTSVNIALISNEGLASEIRKLTSHYLTLPDPLPSMDTEFPQSVDHEFVLFVCSFAVDEPWDVMFKAAAKLGDVQFLCTGKVPKDLDTSQVPDNLNLVGYVGNEEYTLLMHTTSCVIALTTEPECLQCAAYEALSCGKPMVLSGSDAMKKHFGGAAVYVENSCHSIAEGILSALNEPETMSRARVEVKSALNTNFLRQSDTLMHMYRTWCQG